MQVNELIRLLEQPDDLSTWLNQLGFADLDRAAANLDSIARSGMTTDQVATICDQMLSVASEISDLDMALNNLDKFVAAARSPLALGALFQRDTTALPILLTIFSTSQYLADLLSLDTESYDYLRLTEGQLYRRDTLVDELVDAVGRSSESIRAMQIIRRFKRREMLRIAIGDLIVSQPLDQVTRQISYVAEAAIEAAIHFTAKALDEKFGRPLLANGKACRLVVFALGKLGGCELNYSSDIDLIFMYEADGDTSKRKTNRQYFERLTRESIRMLNESTSLGAAYRVDLRLRPEGSRGPICCSKNALLQYYDLQGRNWERQAWIKARPVAGNLELGDETLERLQNWIYRSILNRFDITDIKLLKKQIENRAVVEGDDHTNVKTGFGGIRDIEFSIQFLQLFHGGKVKSVRTPNTLEAIRLLGQQGFLNQQEAQHLEGNYEWLRNVEHRLQIMFDLQTHTLPEDSIELAKTAIRMGYRDKKVLSALEQFRADFVNITTVNNQILNHLLHDTFPTDPDDNGSLSPKTFNVVDLVLQPELEPRIVQQILEPYRFRDCMNAAKLIESLANEASRFLSSRRCRHFFAGTVSELIEQIARTPDPDATLVSLTKVAETIGGKGALWELFNFNPASLELFVRLCASSDYLTSIICSNPGMIDELIDSLSLANLPTIDSLRKNLIELVAGSNDVGPIFHSFKIVQHLRIGIRDILRRDDVRETHRALADVAEVCVNELARMEFKRLAEKHARKDVEGVNSLVVLAMGKLGGREPNYHSDLDVVFVFDSAPENNRWLNISSQHFYGQLALGITRAVSKTSKGKLYDIDNRLRPSGKSGALAVSLAEIERYFAPDGDGQFWERLAWCKARPIYGRYEFCRETMRTVHAAISNVEWGATAINKLCEDRTQMQGTARPENLKRGVGGTVDVEFIVQMLCAKNACECPGLLVPGTVDAAKKLMDCGIIDESTGGFLIESYRYLRGVEARLRLMNLSSRHDLPDDHNLERLAFLLKSTPEKIRRQVNAFRERNRELFLKFFQCQA